MATTHTSACSIRSALLSLSSESTIKTTVTEQRRQTTTAMSVNFILEVKRAGDANGDDVIQRKLPKRRLLYRHLLVVVMVGMMNHQSHCRLCCNRWMSLKFHYFCGTLIELNSHTR